MATAGALEVVVADGELDLFVKTPLDFMLEVLLSSPAKVARGGADL